MTEDDLYLDIITKNLFSMLFCLRSKETCIEIGRMFLKGDSHFDSLKKTIISVDRISKNQTKKAIFTELNPTSTQ